MTKPTVLSNLYGALDELTPVHEFLEQALDLATPHHLPPTYIAAIKRALGHNKVTITAIARLARTLERQADPHSP